MRHAQVHLRGFLVVLALIFLGATPTVADPPDLGITVGELLQIVEDNRVFAVSAHGGQVDTVTGRIGRRWIDERQYERFYGELTAFFDHALQGRPRDFELDRWVENIHLSNRLERRGSWAFATEAESGVLVSYVLTDGALAFVATADPECAVQIAKGPEVWRFGLPDGICGGVFPR
jgi:hypothetical protein